LNLPKDFLLSWESGGLSSAGVQMGVLWLHLLGELFTCVEIFQECLTSVWDQPTRAICWGGSLVCSTKVQVLSWECQTSRPSFQVLKSTGVHWGCCQESSFVWTCWVTPCHVCNEIPISWLSPQQEGHHRVEPREGQWIRAVGNIDLDLETPGRGIMSAAGRQARVSPSQAALSILPSVVCALSQGWVPLSSFFLSYSSGNVNTGHLQGCW
jgi:hypothetical protein